MPVKQKAKPRQSSAIDLKASSFTLPVLTLLDTETPIITKQLEQKVKQAPEFFKNAPLVIDLGQLAAKATIDFEPVIDQIKHLGITPIGIRGGDAAQNSAAQSLGLALLADARPAPPDNKPPVPKKESKPAKQASKSEMPARSTALLVTQPVRSGQRVYAVDNDLIVLAAVSPGAEVMADGNIHIYGVLRGRALAGVKGNTDTRIFCQDLQAELIAISGHYQISEGIEDNFRGKPVQIRLSDSSLMIEEI